MEEFLRQAGVPSVFFTASTRSAGEEMALFADEVVRSSLPDARAFAGVTASSWDSTLRLLATVLPEGPCVVVIDELPYLVASDPSFEGTLQKIFDRELSRRPVLLIGVGSDLAMMEALNSYGRPFHQRAAELVVPPLNPRDVADLLGLPPAEAIDATLVTGGLPLVCAEWPQGASLHDYLAQAVASPTSALLVSAERALAAEFPPELQARSVLATIGAGERTFSTIGRAAGGLPQASLNRSLQQLVAARVVAADVPLSTKPSRETRYRVHDPYLRFWLTFLGPGLPEIERGRGDRVLARIEASWTSWRGRAVEPLLREAVDRLLPDLPLPGVTDDERGTAVVGGWWTRTNNPEIDLVVADRAPVARRVLGVGSFKWLERAPFDESDLARLVVHRGQLPGAADDTPLIAVSRSGVSASAQGVVAVALGPDDVLAAW